VTCVPGPVPADVLDLSRWYLTLPIAEPDGDPDRPWNVYQPELHAFAHPGLFTVTPEGAVEYVAPAKGVTTSLDSGATRCELREMAGPRRGDKASWGFADGKYHSLTCTLTCDPRSVAGRKECLVGQIHDASPTPPIYLAVSMETDRGTLRLFKNGPGVGNLLTGLGPTGVFTYRIRVGDRRCRVWAALGDVSALPEKPAYDFEADDFGSATTGCYFKTGAYNKQPISTATKGQSVVRHHRLDLV
jgi:Alginate lyase